MLKAQIARLQKMVYGARTERTKRILLETANEQMDLFNETESKRRKMCPNRASRCPHVCKRCSVALTSMGKEKLRTEIELIPATIKVIDYCRESFQCLTCRKEEHFSIEKPAMLLYRQEREWKEIGILLSRATLANWIIRPAEDWLMPLAARLQQGLLEQDVIHTDETPVQVCKKRDHKNWVFSDSSKRVKANGLNPFQYLFKHLSNADIQQHPEYLDDVLPWNETIQ